MPGTFGIDRYGRPAGYDQNSPYVQRPQNNTQSAGARNSNLPQQGSAPAPQGQFATANQSQTQPAQQPATQTPPPQQRTQADQATYNQQQYTNMSGTPGQQTNSTGVADRLNPHYAAPAGATRNAWGYWQMPDGSFAPGQNIPGQLGFTPVDSTGTLLPPAQLDPLIANAAHNPNYVNQPAPPSAPPPPGPGPQMGAAPSFHNIQTYQPNALSFNAANYNPFQFAFGAQPQGYQAGTLGQFQAPNQSGIDQQQQSLIQQILANPQTMSPQVVNQQKEAQKEQLMAMQAQTLGQAQQSGAARGMMNSGWMDTQQRKASENLISQLTQGYRDTDLKAAQTNRQDQLNALQGADAFQTNQMNRSTSGYQSQLSGQVAQQQLQQVAAQSQMQIATLMDQRQQLEAQEHQFGANYQLTQAKAQLDAQIANESNRLQASQQQLSQHLAQQEFDENVRQFNANLAEKKRQYDTTLGSGGTNG